jgi:hypothetical protein
MHFTGKDKHTLKVKEWKKIFQISRVQKQARIAILTSDKANFKPKLVRRDKEGHFHIDKEYIAPRNI